MLLVYNMLYYVSWPYSFTIFELKGGHTTLNNPRKIHNKTSTTTIQSKKPSNTAHMYLNCGSSLCSLLKKTKTQKIAVLLALSASLEVPRVV